MLNNYLAGNYKFKSARGGYSRLFDISCRACGSHVLVYQKDGPGVLLRLYLDRIFSPESVIDLQFNELKDIPDLRCATCMKTLAVPTIYEKEQRKAFRLFGDAITKKLKKVA
ncbi:MAG: hypothetical protein NTX91_01945 [candidate division SR1 bacterium]|nr:hypothetical protein [candidate division SR1 bacterium]